MLSLLKIGGANRDRTDDLYNAIVALSQLSYGPDNLYVHFFVLEKPDLYVNNI